MSSSSNSPSGSASQEHSPKKTYRLMAGMALVAMGLIGVAIYSLSQIKDETVKSALTELNLNANLQQNLPEFRFLDGEQSMQSADFLGHWTLLSFWADWCGPCLEEMPALDQLSEQWQGADLEFLTVNVDDPKTENFEAARRFLTDGDISLPTVFDRQGVLKQAFQVHDLPQHFLINPKGKIVWQATGAFKWNEPKARDQIVRAMGEEAFPENKGEEVPAGTPDETSESPSPPATPTQPAAPAK